MKMYVECPSCGKVAYKLNTDTMERHCTQCGFSTTRRGTEHVDMD